MGEPDLRLILTTMWRVAIIVLLGLQIVRCNTPEAPVIENLNGNWIAAMGHGGSGVQPDYRYLPINSRRSIDRAINKHKADGVEVDVQMSRDGQLILFHDHLLERSTDCRGAVNEMLASELIECLYSSKLLQLSPEKESVITLEEVLLLLSGKREKPLLALDVKLVNRSSAGDSVYYELFSTAIVELLQRFNYAEHTLIESQSAEFLTTLRRHDPQLKLFIYPGDFESGFKVSKENELFGITINSRLISKSQVALAHEHGLYVTIWGVGSKRSCRAAISKQPDFIQTDNIKKLRKLLDA